MLSKEIMAAVNTGNDKAVCGMIRRFYSLQQHLGKPWEVKLSYDGKVYSYIVSNRVNHEQIAEFMNSGKQLLESGAGIQPVDQLYNKLTERLHYGG